MVDSDDAPSSPNGSIAAIGSSTINSNTESSTSSSTDVNRTSINSNPSPHSHSLSHSHSHSQYRPLSRFSFPRAAQPEIVRAFQKDVYYRDLLQNQLKDVVRSLFGTRFLHSRTELVALIGSLAYYSLSSLGGSQTLGEEYVNAMMTETKNGKIAGVARRGVFISLHVLAPFLLTRIYSSFRRFILLKHASRAQAAQRQRMREMALRNTKNRSETNQKGQTERKESRIDRILAFLAEKLPEMSAITATDGWLAYAGAAHLAIFYLGGRYYGVAQRLAGVEYISTIPPRPGSRPPSYEVLGVLLAIQLTVKFGMSLNQWRSSRKSSLDPSLSDSHQSESSSEKSGSGGAESKKPRGSDSVSLDGRIWSHSSFPPVLQSKATDPDHHRGLVPLSYPAPDLKLSLSALGLTKEASSNQINALRASLQGKASELEAISESVLKCTLCMELRTPEKGNSAVTECGHVFCWDCIIGWAEEKPECPLCRQSISPNRLLPVYNF